MQDHYNKIILIGAVAKYVDVLTDPNGRPISEVTLAGSEETTGSDGKPRTLTWYHRFFLPGADPAWVARTFPKGMVVEVHGSIHPYREVLEGKSRTEVVIKASTLYSADASPEDLLLDRYGSPRLKGATNILCVVGHLGRKPEIKTAANGNAYCFFPLHMFTSSLFDKGNSNTVFQEVQVACWGSTAQAIAAFELGERILVVGKLVHERWQSPEGEPLKMSRIMADDVLQGDDIDAFLTRLHLAPSSEPEETSQDDENDVASSRNLAK